MTPAGPIDAYLDALLGALRLDPGATRRVVTEAEDHLHETADALVSNGMDLAAAEEAAVARFGPAELVAAGFNRVARPGRVRGEVVRSVVVLAGIGLLAIGASGALAAALGAAFGKAFVAGDGPGVAYSTQRCAELFALAPGAPDCAAAATAHHYDEEVGYRLDAGILGAAVLLAYAAYRWRRRPAVPVARSLPSSTFPAVGTALFSTAALGLFVLGTLPLFFSNSNGAGAWLSAAIVSAGVGGAFAWRFVTTLRRPNEA